jgi:ArsR family metal-binding transcriptional regulator
MTTGINGRHHPDTRASRSESADSHPGASLSDTIITTFATGAALTRATALLDTLGLDYEVLAPPRAFGRVALPALAADADLPREIARRDRGELVCAGWVERHASAVTVPDTEPVEYADDLFGDAAIMLIASCTTDEQRLRCLAHLSGDLSDAFPYLNAVMPAARFNPKGPTLTYLEEHRLVTLYARRVAIAKADELIDAWRLLEDVRRRVNDAWARRDEITPSWEARAKPTLLDLIKALPRTNCRACGQATCTAFATRLLNGVALPAECLPIWEGDYAHLKEPLIDLCAGIELVERAPL